MGAGADSYFGARLRLRLRLRLPTQGVPSTQDPGLAVGCPKCGRLWVGRRQRDGCGARAVTCLQGQLRATSTFEAPAKVLALESPCGMDEPAIRPTEQKRLR